MKASLHCSEHLADEKEETLPNLRSFLQSNEVVLFARLCKRVPRYSILLLAKSILCSDCTKLPNVLSVSGAHIYVDARSRRGLIFLTSRFVEIRVVILVWHMQG